MHAYIAELRRTISQTACPTKRPSLEKRFRGWFDSLPAEMKNRPFSMHEFEEAMGSHGRYISAVLVQLGWRRMRVWSAQRYCRYWIPPRPDVI